MYTFTDYLQLSHVLNIILVSGKKEHLSSFDSAILFLSVYIGEILLVKSEIKKENLYTASWVNGTLSVCAEDIVTTYELWPSHPH